ncbi:MAG: colicin production protein [Caulobacteraceae bacterium]|nr:colicin production protein [Caulobacteraceae bacterium]
MTAFDYAAGLVLLVSGLFGFARGATHEITTVIALVVAAVLAVAALVFTAPLALHVIHTPWLAEAAAVLLTFILIYAILRLIGGALTRGVKQTSLSGLDRLLGFGVGLVRALVVLGGFILLIDAATPPERMPAWITGAKLYPLASAAGGALRTFAPGGLKVAHDVAPSLTDAVNGDTPPPATPAPHHRRVKDPGTEEPR